MRRYLLPSLLALFICHDALGAERSRSRKQDNYQEGRKKKRRKKVRYLPQFRIMGEGGYVGYSETEAEAAAGTATKTAQTPEPQNTAWHGALVAQGVFSFTPKFAAVAGLGGGVFYLTSAVQSTSATINASTMVWLIQPELGLEVAFNKTFSAQTVVGYDFGLSGDRTVDTGAGTAATNPLVMDTFTRLRIQPRMFLNLGSNFHLLVPGFIGFGDTHFMKAEDAATAATATKPVTPDTYFAWNVGAGLGTHF